MRFSRRTLLALASAELLPANPVFRTGVPAATKDKPQSKLWFAHGSWWAILPGNGGPSLWQRASAAWQRQAHLDSFLNGLPAQADVLTTGDTAAAVLVEPARLAVIRLVWNPSKAQYQPANPPVVFDDQKGIETATIAHSAGKFWIAYNAQRHMWARSSESWSRPAQVTLTAAKDDDICQIVAFAGGIGVIWSDQAADAVFLRRHTGQTWLQPETAENGGNTADDHISTAVARDGTLYVATKNSVDTLGQPQLVLRIRNPRGQWRNLSYAPLTPIQGPTRPIALLSADQRTLHLLHTVASRGSKPPTSAIVLHATPAAAPRFDSEPRVLIGGPHQINNVTGPKYGSGLVLASDNEGNIYEARVE